MAMVEVRQGDTIIYVREDGWEKTFRIDDLLPRKSRAQYTINPVSQLAKTACIVAASVKRGTWSNGGSFNAKTAIETVASRLRALNATQIAALSPKGKAALKTLGLI